MKRAARCVYALLRTPHRRGRWRVGAALTAAALCAATTAPPAARGDSQGCADAGTRPVIDWERLRNPILELPDRAVKDAAMRFSSGAWHVFASDIVEGPDRARFRVSHWTSRDLTDLGQPRETLDDPTLGGFASADITRVPGGEYVVAFNSHTTDVDGTEEDLYVRSGGSLRTLGAPVRLAHEVHPGDDERSIDVALAHAEAGSVIGYKLGQALELAISPSGSLDGPFEVIGQPGFDQQPTPVAGMQGIENYQFLQLDGTWHMLATSIPSYAELVTRGAALFAGAGVDEPQHRTLLFTLEGDPTTREGWLDWSEPRELVVPQETWNSPRDAASDHERQNAAFLCDLTAVDGFYYLLYAGSRELSTFDGRGHAKLGIARSTDLTTWEVPPPR